MFVVLEDRFAIASAIVACFVREGISAVAVATSGFEEWLAAAAETEISGIEGVLVGIVERRTAMMKSLKFSVHCPVIAILDERSLRETLERFAEGVSDVVTKPFHVREILVRVAAIRGRYETADHCVEVDGIKIFFDGQDPQVLGEPIMLPRRERRILEYLMVNRGQRLTKTQIYNRVYGAFNDETHDTVIESHMSRLRKRLRERLGYDPIESQRYLGYKFIGRTSHSDSTGISAWPVPLAHEAAGIFN